MLQEVLARIGVTIDVAFNLIFLSLIWVRILAMGVVIPFLLGKPVPRYVLVGASMVLALFAFPNLVPSAPPPLTENFLALFMLYLKETFYGLSIGFGVAILFYGLEAAGAMVDNQRGVSIARVLIPQLAEQSSITGSFLFQLAIVLYLVIGGHRLFFDSFFMSFKTLPVLAFPAAGAGLFPMMDLFIKITGEVLLISIQLSAPIIIAIFVADIILGIANRVAPQINVWELGFNVKGYLGVLLLFLAITMIGDQIVHYSLKSGQYAVQVMEHLEGKAAVEEPEFPIEEQLKREQVEIPPVVNP
jgi:type III secretory pathway component EscT